MLLRLNCMGGGEGGMCVKKKRNFPNQNVMLNHIIYKKTF